MHFMLQKEVVDRLVASENSRDYGRLTIMVQYYCKVERLFLVSPTAFKPPPKVESAVVRLIPYCQLPYPAHNVKILEQIVRAAFSQRRKMLSNSVKNLISTEQLLSLEINPNWRAEQVSLKDYVRISNFIVEGN